MRSSIVGFMKQKSGINRATVAMGSVLTEADWATVEAISALLKSVAHRPFDKQLAKLVAAGYDATGGGCGCMWTGGFCGGEDVIAVRSERFDWGFASYGGNCHSVEWCEADAKALSTVYSILLNYDDSRTLSWRLERLTECGFQVSLLPNAHQAADGEACFSMQLPVSETVVQLTEWGSLLIPGYYGDLVT
jgi:hypothetical protein